MPAIIQSPRLVNAGGTGRPDTGPLIDALDAFGIPFLSYGRLGQRLRVGRATTCLLSDAAFGPVLGRQADDIARESVFKASQASADGGVVLGAERTALGGLMTIALYKLRPPSGETSTLVLFRTATPSQGHGQSFASCLTRRQLTIARLVADGLSTKSIAARLHLSTHTVRHHLEHAFRKLGVNNRAALVGLLTPHLQESNPASPSLLET